MSCCCPGDESTCCCRGDELTCCCCRGDELTCCCCRGDESTRCCCPGDDIFKRLAAMSPMKAVNSALARNGRSARYRWELREIGAGDTGSGRPAAREGTEKHVGPHRHLDSRHREEGLGIPRVWTDRSSWDRGERPSSATGTGRRPGHHNSAGGTPCRGSLRKRRRTRTRECDRQQPGGVAAQCAARERATGKGLATHSSRQG